MDIRILTVFVFSLFNYPFCWGQKSIEKVKFVYAATTGINTGIPISCVPHDFDVGLRDLDYKIVRDSIFIGKFALLLEDLKPDTSVVYIDARIMAIVTYKQQMRKDTLCFGEFCGVDWNGTFMKDNPKLLSLVKKEIWSPDVPEAFRKIPYCRNLGSK